MTVPLCEGLGLASLSFFLNSPADTTMRHNPHIISTGYHNCSPACMLGDITTPMRCSLLANCKTATGQTARMV